MSVILVWKGKSACMVNKQRDPAHKGKYIEKYLGSMGVISNEEMVLRRDKMYVFDTDQERIMFAKHAFHFVETKEDIPRRKDKTQTSGQVKAKSKKRTTKKKEIKELPIYDKDAKPEKQSVVRKDAKLEGLKLEGYKSITAKQKKIDQQIAKINKSMDFPKSVIKQKSKVQTFTKTDKEAVQRELKYMKSIVEAGNKAITILKKQKAELRR